VVATAATRKAAAAADGDEPRWQWSSLPARRIKGVEGSVQLYRARPSADALS
jgi:class 3 adenylate cyclase